VSLFIDDFDVNADDGLHEILADVRRLRCLNKSLKK
jgi:hypothetical protein